MKIFLDSGNLKEIKKAKSLGVIRGVTTNPTLIAKEKIKGRKAFLKHVKDMCDITQLPVSAEVIGLETNEIIDEGEELSAIDPNVVIKIPLNECGLKAISYFSKKNIATNATVIFSPLQAVLAATNGASYVSPYLGRLDKICHNGLDMVQTASKIFKIYNYQSEIIVASIRSIHQILETAKAGVDIVTISYTLIEEMLYHPLTDIGIQQFLDDWKNVE